MTVVFASGGIAALQLETLVDPAPAALPPRVRVTVTGVASATTFTLTRLCEGESWTAPGYSARRFTDSDVYLDWAAPLNRPITYTLSANGSAICSATITLTSSTAIIQDPIQPDVFIPVQPKLLVAGSLTLAADALKKFDYNLVSTLIPVLGSRYPVAIGGQRAAAAGFDLSMISPDTATSNAMRALLAGTPIVLYRPLVGAPLPALSYGLVEASEAPYDLHEGGTVTGFTVTADLVAAVQQAAISGYVTYDQVQQLLAGVTYAAVQTKYSGLTYLDLQKDPLKYKTL